MRPTIILLILISVTIRSAFAQTPSKQEVQNQMSQVVQKLNQNISDLEKQIAEAKKNKEAEGSIRSMEDQLAMLKKQVRAMGEMTNGISKISAKTIQQASRENEPNFTVPKRDNERIKMLPDGVLKDQQLAPYLKNVITEVEKKISAADKKIAEKLRSGITNRTNYINDLAGVANTCWMNGYPEIALILMGQACMADTGTGNSNNLNNYAAFLTMAGADHAALPILQNLNQKYPNNSTILNNIGQAWYGLGDMNNAKKYLNETVRFYALHSQANQTMCIIEQSEGNNEQAIESLKRSIAENYTTEKEARLHKLGGELNYEDIKFRYPIKGEPLGIEKFLNSIPDYPFMGGETAQNSVYEWDNFRQQVADAAAVLEKKKLQIDAEVNNWRNRMFGKTVSKPITDPNQINYAALAKQVNPLLKPYNSPVYKTAKRKYELLLLWAGERFLALAKKMQAASDSVGKWKNEFYDALNITNDCSARFNLATDFMSKANRLWQQRNAEWLTIEKEFLNARSNYAVYASLDQWIYRQDMVVAKLELLNFLAGAHCEFEVGCFPSQDEKKPTMKNLPDFDSVNCTYHDKFNVPPFAKFEFECNKMKTEFEIAIDFNYGPELSPYIKIGFEENLTNNTTIKPSDIIKKFVEAGAEIGSGKLHLGPIEVEAKAEAGMGMEFSKHGLEMVYGKAGAKLDVGPDVEGGVSNYDPLVNVETKISWNAGSEKVGSHLEGEFEAKAFRSLLEGIQLVHLSTGPIK